MTSPPTTTDQEYDDIEEIQSTRPLTRRKTIADRFMDTIPDAKQISNDNRMKYTKHEMVPPLTLGYRQLRALREIENLRITIERNMKVCDMNDASQKKMLQDIMKKHEDLKAMFEMSERAHDKLEKDREEHKLAMEAAVKEIENHNTEMKQYNKAADSVSQIRLILENVIQANECYVAFLDEIAGESGQQSPTGILEKFESLFSVRSELRTRLDQSLKTLEKTKQIVANTKGTMDQQLSYDLGQLQKVDYKLNRLASKNLTFETAMNHASVESQSRQRMIEMVLKSARQMVENLVASGVIDKSYLDKTLAQQFEAIREDYIKKKMALNEYNRAVNSRNTKSNRRGKAHVKYGKGWVYEDAGKMRIEELLKKRKMMNYSEELRKFAKTRRTSSKASEEYDPLKDIESHFRLRGHSRITIHTELSDDEFDDEASYDLSFLENDEMSNGPLEETWNEIDSLSPLGSIDMSGDSRSSDDVRLSVTYSVGSAHSQITNRRRK